MTKKMNKKNKKNAIEQLKITEEREVDKTVEVNTEYWVNEWNYGDEDEEDRPIAPPIVIRGQSDE